MNRRAATIILLVLCVLPFVITAIGMQFLPDSVPMHYDFAGNVDRWGSKYENFILAAVFSGSGLLMLLIAKLAVKLTDTDEEREKAKSNEKIVLYSGIGMMVLFCVLQASFLAENYKETVLGLPASMEMGWNITGVGMGILMIIMGNYMPKAKRNSAVGVRTTWSMSSDEAWAKSQRFGGKVFVIGGIELCILTGLLKGLVIIWALLAVVLIAAAVCVYYSYRVGGQKQEG
ncbi:MAG: SdpI family protein [Oscillospiraceae bacterium]|nr:SdpI family protein [Oscillospiraceae bacterium]